MSGRPVVTSHAIPAASYVRDAIALAAHDDPYSLARRLHVLSVRTEIVKGMHSACEREVAKFFDPRTNYQAAIEHVLDGLRAGQEVLDRTVSFTGEVVS
jgi:hypothetical protein